MLVQFVVNDSQSPGDIFHVFGESLDAGAGNRDVVEVGFSGHVAVLLGMMLQGSCDANLVLLVQR